MNLFVSGYVDLSNYFRQALMTRKHSTSKHILSRESSETMLASSWREFATKFPTDADSLEELYRHAGLRKCNHCGSVYVTRIHGARTIRCTACKRKTWFTADTFFHRIKRPQAWLGYIWLFDHGIIVNPSRFHKLAGVAYDTARNIFKKLAMVMASYMKGNSVPSSEFAPIIGKRSRETPARAHPRAEEAEMEKKTRLESSPPASIRELEKNSGPSPQTTHRHDNLPDNEPGQTEETCTGLSVPISSVELSEQERIVYRSLSEEPVTFDNLCIKLKLQAGKLSAILTMLELAGLATAMIGNRYVRSPSQNNAVAGRLASRKQAAHKTCRVTGIIDFLRQYFHAVSRKDLQLYLAAHWFMSDRAARPCSSLLQSCFRFRHVPCREMLEFVSPLLVKISPCLQ